MCSNSATASPNASFDEIVPEKSIPSCWKDQNRLNVLFAPFREKQINPVEWDTKYADWKHLIYLYVSSNKMLSFTLLDLEKAFVHNKRVPTCLQTVLDEMKREGILENKPDFMKEASETWSGWMTDVLIKSPIRWSFSKIRNSIGTQLNNFVHLLTVQEEAKRLLAVVPEEYKHKVIDLQQLSSLVQNKDFSFENLQIVLHYLRRKKEIALKYLNNERRTILIKLDNRAIEDQDVTIYSLKNCEVKLKEEIEQLEAKTVDFTKEAKKHVVNGNKNMGLHALKRKHANEKRIDAKYKALHNIEAVLSDLEDAHMNLALKDTYKEALDALKDANSVISADDVDEIMIDVQENITRAKDVSRTIGTSLDDSTNDEELEQELNELIADHQQTKEAAKLEELFDNLKLPNDQVNVNKKEIKTLSSEKR